METTKEVEVKKLKSLDELDSLVPNKDILIFGFGKKKVLFKRKENNRYGDPDYVFRYRGLYRRPYELKVTKPNLLLRDGNLVMINILKLIEYPLDPFDKSFFRELEETGL